MTPGSPNAAEEALAAEEAKRDSPEAVAERRASATAFENLDSQEAGEEDVKAFPGVVDEPAGGPPKLPAGESITGFPTDDAASIALGGGQVGIVESTAPMAIEGANGQRRPVDLSLSEAGGEFEPKTPVVPVRIPKRLGAGVSLGSTGVSLTPVDASGASLGGSEGALEGASVVYANTQTDADTLVKPTTFGFEADTMLRSVESPSQLYFRVGLPAGASLVQAQGGSGSVEVVKEGVRIATIPSPGAQDAAGTAVPVSMSVSGDTLALSVEDHAAEHLYPVEVDPSIIDEQLVAVNGERAHWEWHGEPSGDFKDVLGSNYLETQGAAEYAKEDWAGWAYETHGDSKIFDVSTKTGPAKNKEAKVESFLELEHGEIGSKGVEEAKTEISNEYKEPEYIDKGASVCPDNSKKEQECLPELAHEKNAVLFEQAATASPKGHYKFEDRLDEALVSISEPAGQHATASFNKTTPEFTVEVEEGGKKVKQSRHNALYSNSWLSKSSVGAVLGLISEDKGIGVDDTKLEYESSPGKWELISACAEHNYRKGTECHKEAKCEGVQCYEKHEETWLLESKLPNGEDKVRYRAEEAMEGTESPASEDEVAVKVDTSSPRNLFLAGLPYGNELAERKYELTAYATDGEGSTIASSGIQSIELYVEVNGKSTPLKELNSGEGKCSTQKGECTASAKFDIEGAELGAGHHTIIIVAKDNAGNEEREEESISIRHSTPVPLGPGDVDLESGDFTLGPTDVSLGSGLSVSRIYSSRDVTAGEESGSLLGPQWSLSAGSEESLVEMPDKSVLVTSGNGGQTVFAVVFNSKGEPTGKFEPPPGDSNLMMTLEENEKKEKIAYYLKDPAAGTSTKFVLSSTAKVWVPTAQEGPVSSDTVSYIYEAVEVGGKKVTRPKEERGATPAKVSCAPKAEPGCHVLKFTYATATKAKGESPSEWGEYEGRLSKVSYEGYNPATKKMTETPIPVAEYTYDKQGRLRAEWDPRVEGSIDCGKACPALKSEYGYDAEGHVTALDPPGHEPWVLTYGTIAGDAGTGRLIKVMQAPVSAGLWGGELPGNSEAPKLSAAPVVGAQLSVSDGTWSHGPIAYSYQWEDCNSKGEECTRIAGANNQSYRPVSSDEGHTLRAQVSATNGGGSVTATSEAQLVTWGLTVSEFPAGKAEVSEGGPLAAGPDGNVWFRQMHDKEGKFTYIVGKITPSDAITEYELPSSSGYGSVAAGPDGDMWFTESSANKVGKMTTSGVISAEYELPIKDSDPYNITAGPDGNMWFIEGGTKKIGKLTTSGTLAEYSLPSSEMEPDDITAGPDGNLWVTESHYNSKGDYYEGAIGKVTTSGVVSEYSLPDGGYPLDITAGPDGNLWFTVPDQQDVDKITTWGAITKYSLGEDAEPNSIAAGADGNLWIASESQKSVYQVTTSGAWTELSVGGQASHISAGPDGNVWFASFESNKIGKVIINQSDSYAPQPGSTIEYNVLLEGWNAPAQLGVNGETDKPEPEKWGQKDDPVEATAITPPDSPQGWPASSYKRASVYYMDKEGRVVNTAMPSTGTYGSISTTEYNETNDAVRTLTPDNRATALEEGCESESKCKSAEKAKLLSTENTYNGEGEKESEVAEPGTQLILSRGPEHMVKYTAGEEYYESGEKAKEGMARSLTKYFYNEGAPSENPRTKKKETYDLATRTQNYAELINKEGVGSETTDVRETKTSYSGQNDLGWQLRAPTSVTTNPNSLDTTTTTEYYENEASETFGQVEETRGAGAAGTLTYASKFGEAGSEAGKLSSPFAAAIDSEGNIWVADTGNNRIEKFGPEGKYISAFGKAGSEVGELKEPKSIVIYKGDLWVAESGNDRIQEFNTEGKSLQTFGKAGSGNGELKEPKALAIDSHGNVWVADTGNNRIEEFSEKGEYVSSFGKAGSAPGELKEPKGIAIDSKEGKEYIWVSDTGNNRIQEFNTEGKLLAHFGETGSGAGQVKTPFGIAFDPSGHLWVVDDGNDRVQELSSSGAFITQFGWDGSEPGQLKEPRGLAIDAKGDVWAVDTANSRLEEWSKGPNAHDSKVVYYTLEENKEYAECGKHPEWAGLVCETLPAKQPELAGLPRLPVTSTTYNIWNEPETIEETFGSGAEAKKRTTKDEYDPAGRLTSSEKTSTATTETTDRALPKVTEEYSATTGVLEKQSTKVGETTKTISSTYNTLGQLETSTDADGNVAKFKYGGPEEDGLLEEMSDGSDGGESNQKYTYNVTTKQLEKLVDSAAGTFTASYDTEGKLESEVYPNGMCASYAYNAAGEATRVAYLKTMNCSEKEPAVWYSDERVPSIRGEMMSQTSTLASESYAYDQAGRLTEVQETPAGEGCTTRLYAYEESSNRTSLTTRKPGSEGKCATEGGTVAAHDYDEADRLTDSGIAYDPLGNVTKLPSGDAEGHALESTFYVDNAVATQTQNGVTNDYYMDPAGRVRETITGAKKVISHYDGSGEAVAWTCEGAEKASTCESGAKWTRDIPGIDGTLTAVENGTGATYETPILQLHDLQGDIVATIKDKTGETKLASTYNSTEFGAPNGGKEPPKFAWLGAGGVEKSLASGVITEGATSYVPQIGKALQPEGVDPVGEGGSGGGAAYTSHVEPWVWQGAGASAAEAPGKEAEREKEAEEAACRADLTACEEGSDPEFGENTHGCKVWASWGSVGFSNKLTVYGHFKCTYASYGFELGVELQLIEAGGVLNGTYKLEHSASKVFSKSENGGEHSEYGEFECRPGKWYRLIAWGRYWYTTSYSPWHAYSVDGRPMRCPLELPEGEPPKLPRL